MQSRDIDLSGLQITKGKTFHWDGYYEYDMNQAHTLNTQLNVFEKFEPSIPDKSKGNEFVFLANMDPRLQLKVIENLDSPRMIVADTMNFWIDTKKQALLDVVKKVDVILLNDMEARQLTDTPSVVVAAKKLLGHGAKSVIIKKGEHGALFFSKDCHFSAPSYPQENLKDPTGAGDSFAGGFIGYLAKSGDTGRENIKKAVIIGSVMASFNVEDFSLDRMRTLKEKEINARFDEFIKFSRFECLRDKNEKEEKRCLTDLR